MNVLTSTPRRPARVYLAIATVVTGLLLGACGPTASITLNLDATTVTLFLGAGEDVEVTLTRSADATAAVELSATGAPAWATVTFAPATLSGGALASTMTITTDSGHPDAGPQAFTLTVMAQGPGLSASAQLAVEVLELDVNGVVLGGRDEPLAGYTVYIPGHTATVSAVDGTFSFEGVSAPYDLTVVDPVSGFTHTFVGLTTPSPSPRPLGALLSSTTEFSASVGGNLVHGSLVPLPAQHRAVICIEGIVVPMRVGCTSVSEASSTFSVPVQWSGAATASVRLRAFVYQVDGEGETTAIVASGSFGPFDISDSDVVAQDVTLTNTTTQAVVNTTTTVPIGYTLNLRQLVAHHTPFASSSVGDGLVGTALSRGVIAPFFAGVEYSVVVGASSNAIGSSSSLIAWSAGHAPGDSVTLALPRPSVQVAPPDAATGVSESTEFTVVNPDGGVVSFVIQPTGGGSVYIVTTAGTSASIPDLAPIGFGLPSSAAYGWTTLTSHEVATTDEAVTGDGYLGHFTKLSAASSGAGPGPTTGGLISTSESRAFTTQ